ncbi:MAG: transporter [Deferrisomatales bacterium]
MAETSWKVVARLPTACLLVLALALASPSWAGFPASGQHYPNGAEDFVVGALPPPGVYLKTYFALIQKDRLKGSLGLPPFAGVKDDAKTPVDFEADVAVVVPRFIWVTPWSLFGASVATQAFFPLHWTEVRSTGLGIATEEAALGDIIYTPVALGWHFGPNLHVILAEDLFLPTGEYQSADIGTQLLSKNHWTFESVLAVTYLWQGVDFSAKFMYDFNTENDDYVLGGAPGKLDPGQELHIDWALSYAKGEGLRYGISGYAYWQTTKDEFTPDGGGGKMKAPKGQVFAAGPTIKYWPKQGRFSAVLKHQWEFGAENLPEGQTTWLNIVWVF